MSTFELTFRDIERTDAIEECIKKKVDKLTQHCPQMLSCRIMIHQIKKHQHQGKLYGTDIVVTVPHGTLVSNKQRDADLYVVIRDAFASMTRIIDEQHQRQTGEVKAHPTELSGKIARLFGEDDGYGFITDALGNEFYFHNNNLHGSQFNELTEGQSVHFISATGDEGPQAHRVVVEK